MHGQYGRGMPMVIKKRHTAFLDHKEFTTRCNYDHRPAGRLFLKFIHGAERLAKAYFLQNKRQQTVTLEALDIAVLQADKV